MLLSLISQGPDEIGGCILSDEKQINTSSKFIAPFVPLLRYSMRVPIYYSSTSTCIERRINTLQIELFYCNDFVFFLNF